MWQVRRNARVGRNPPNLLALTDTIQVSSELAVLTETIFITDEVPAELNLAVLTTTLPVTESLVLDSGESLVLTETVEITVTGVLSSTLMIPTVEFYPLALVAETDVVQSEPAWSYEVHIEYEYDPLNRLTQAVYSDGRQFDFTHDAVGNCLTQSVDLGSGAPVLTTYQYDIANRLEYVDSQPHTWDDNGNLLSDDVGTYTYNHANHLASVTISGMANTTFRYNGLGDRLEQTVDMHTTRYTLDLASGLTQVLADGTYTYLYGEGRIAQYIGTAPEYFLADALGSARQLVDASGSVTLAKGYQPYGEVLESAGSGSSAYGYTGEWTDNSGLVYLRARYYSPMQGRFMTRDTWGGEQGQPMSYNKWLYTYANPINFVDPSGYYPCSNCDLVPFGHPRDMCQKYCDDCDGEEAEFQPVGVYNLSAYYVVHETQYYSGPGSRSGPIPSLGDITANKYFLFSQAGVCMAGTGKLKDGKYIGCVSHVDWNQIELAGPNGEWVYMMPPNDRQHREEIPFFWKNRPAPPQFQAFETVAVCSSGSIPRDANGNVEIRIIDASFEIIMRNNGADNILKVTDEGGGLCATNGIDVFIGEQPSYQKDPGNDFYNLIAAPIIAINDAYVELRLSK